MEIQHHPLIRHLAISAATLVCGSLAILGWLIWPSSAWARSQERAEAEQRWARRPFGHYRLEISDKRCPQRIEIRNERVVRVDPNRCDAPPRSITDLFDLIRRDETVSYPCILAGCICDDIIRVRASYDPQLGYPTRIIVRIRAEPNWRHPDFWRALWRHKRIPSCDALAEGSKLIQVLTLTPTH